MSIIRRHSADSRNGIQLSADQPRQDDPALRGLGSSLRGRGVSLLDLPAGPQDTVRP
ncbi:hypothetical protein DPMN_166763 [Dreissena polymorpha]|uniref:Uncharacterized protein n=1 Tax=Dreissena polymorpha TaxID=45954 RepID=A0A9D4IXW9_DREPO|nr:hypothetical protein DPMN_166763 [Dreissena polymorpha]